MNERIRELVLEAGFVHYGEDMGFYNIPVPAFNSRMEKFAELIVKDFQKLIKDTYLNTAPEHRDCLLMLDARVEEHFGVD